MTGKQIKRLVAECVNLINTVDYAPFKEDIDFSFVSKDERYRVKMDIDCEYWIEEFNPAFLKWKGTGYSLEDCDATGIDWQCTQDTLDRFEDAIVEVQEHIRAHESDIALFERMVNTSAGETILSCL